MPEPGEHVETRLARMEEQMHSAIRQTEVFGPTAGQVILLEERLLRLRADVTEVDARMRADLLETEDKMHGSLRRTEDRLEKLIERVEKAGADQIQAMNATVKSFTDRMDSFSSSRTTSRATIIVGAIGAGTTILGLILPRVLG